MITLVLFQLGKTKTLFQPLLKNCGSVMPLIFLNKIIKVSQSGQF